MSARDLALTLLSQGIQQHTVAETIGVDPSYISSLMADEDFKAELESKRLAETEENLAYDDKLDRAEEAFLERLQDKIRLANLRDSMQAFRVLNSAKRRRDRGVVNPSVVVGVAVNLQLPQVMVPKYVTNSKNEIVEVDGQTMVTTTASLLDKMVAAKKAAALPAPATPAIVKQIEQAREERAAVVLDAVGPVLRKRRQSKADIFSVDML